MKQYFKVSFQYSESVFCANIAMAEKESDVAAHYSEYSWYSIRPAEDYEIESAREKGMPFVECPAASEPEQPAAEQPAEAQEQPAEAQEQPAAEQPAEAQEQPAEAQEQPAEAQEQPAARRTGCGYYNKKVLTKFRDALQQARADYAADPDRYDVTISHANSKMGAVASVSLLPFLTCPGCCKTTCGAKCYAAKLANLRPAVLRSYAMNTAIWQADPEKYFRQVSGAMAGVRFFRFHVSGDIPGRAYFSRMISACVDNPHCEVLCFTKAFDVVNSYLRDIGCAICSDGYDVILPGNLHLLFSGWSNLDPENPYGLPETNVIERGAEPRENWKVCGGNCLNCACRGVGCWQAGAGDTIAFPIH